VEPVKKREFANEEIEPILKEGFTTDRAVGFLLIPYLLVFNFHELMKKMGITREGISALNISLELVYMIFFSIARVSHLDAVNNSSDRGFSVLCGISKVTHHTLLLGFIKSFTR